jgi:hypothetical protein
MSCYLVQEIDGVSRFTLENGTGFLLLEDCPAPPGGTELPIGGLLPVRRGRRRLEILDEDEMLTIVLGDI